MVDQNCVFGLINIMPKIQRLTVRLCPKGLYGDIIPLSQLISLKYLKLYYLNLDERRELLYIVSVLKSASNLVELDIEIYCCETQVPEHLEELECSSSCIRQLQTVNIKVGKNFQSAMTLTRFILSNSSSLKTLTFDIGFGYMKLDADVLLSISRDLLWMERASQRAHIKFVHV